MKLRKSREKDTEKIRARYHADVRFLESFANSAHIPPADYKKIGKGRALEQVRTFLDLLGNPEKNLKIVHIAGTSGKGSTVKILERLIAASRCRVGAYTSPFASTTIEKFSVDETLMHPDELHGIIEHQIKPALDTYAKKQKLDFPSYFEICLAIALLSFRAKKCEYAILETGLGGTYDATNVINRPIATAITAIGLDHTHILGATKSEIAHDKAGIMKKDVPFLTGEVSPALMALFKKRARNTDARFIETQPLVQPEDSYGNYFSTEAQKRNLNLALNIYKAIGLSFPSNIPKLCANFSLPARQEVVAHSPTIVLDGAHNTDKLRNVAAFVRTIPHERRHIIIGMADQKLYRPALHDLIRDAESVTVTRFLNPFRKALDPRILARDCRRYAPNVSIFMDPWQALGDTLARADRNDLILITGSFFLAGELRTRWISEDSMLGLAPHNFTRTSPTREE